MSKELTLEEARALVKKTEGLIRCELLHVLAAIKPTELVINLSTSSQVGNKTKIEDVIVSLDIGL